MLIALALCASFAVGASAASAAVITGTVDGEGQSPAGLAEAQVAVTEPGSGTQVAATSTALDGTYRAEVPEGTYDVTVTPPFGDGLSSAREANEVVGAEAVLNFTLASSESSSSFSGVLRGEKGQPIAGAQIDLGNNSVGVGATTAANGSFSANVPAGTYALSVTGTEAGASQGTFYVSIPKVVISGALRENLTLPAHTITLEVVGPHGEPVPGATVAVKEPTCCATLSFAPGLKVPVTSGPGPAGHWSCGYRRAVYFDAPGYQEAEISTGSAALADPTPVRLATTPADQTRRVVLASSATFSGTLYGYRKTPLSGVTISASGPTSAKTSTASDGSFALTLEPGEYMLTITGEHPSGVSAITAPRRFSFTTDAVTVTESASVDLTLPLHALSVTANGPEGPAEEVPIVANGGGSLAAGQALAPGVEIASAQTSDWAYTNGHGTASVSLPDFAEGSAFVRVESSQTWKEAQISASGISENSSRTLSLTPATPQAYTFSGRVQTSDGVPVAAWLTLERGEYGKPGYLERSAVTYTDGASRSKCRLPAAPPEHERALRIAWRPRGLATVGRRHYDRR